MEEPGTWGFIWLVAAAVLGVGEIFMAGTFFLLPFAAGALVAAIASFAGAPLFVSWGLFIVTSVVAFLGLKPLARRLDIEHPNPIGTGANRLIGDVGVVALDIPAGPSGTGMVKIGGEEWRAEGRDGMGVQQGSQVRIVAVEGTRVIVEPIGRL
jgi:membrane protein implicated in regulation of membrane protease activity